MDRTQKQLSMLAERLRNNDRYMAWVLEVYRRQERMTVEALAEKLDAAPERYALLAICKRPERESDTFGDQVRQIAAYTNVNPAVLGNLIRQVDSLQTLAGASQEQAVQDSGRHMAPLNAGVLAAARDRVDAEQEKTGSSDLEEPSEGKQNKNGGANRVAG